MKSYDHFAFPIAVDKGAGMVAEADDYDRYIKTLVLQTIMTAQGERINRPSFGASIRRMLFDPLRSGVERFVQTMVLEALSQWLSAYIRTQDVRVHVEDSKLVLEIDYRVIARGEIHYLTMEVVP